MKRRDLYKKIVANYEEKSAFNKQIPQVRLEFEKQHTMKMQPVDKRQILNEINSKFRSPSMMTSKVGGGKGRNRQQQYQVIDEYDDNPCAAASDHFLYVAIPHGEYDNFLYVAFRDHFHDDRT